MKYFKVQFIFKSLLLSIGFFAVSLFSVEAQSAISDQPLNITSVGQYEVYPYYQESSFGSGSVGVCLLGSFYSPTSTSVKFRYTPLLAAQQSDWIYSSFTSPINPPSTGINATFAVGIEPETEYVVQAFEVGLDGAYHDITPSLTTDNVKLVCSPTVNGGVSSNCTQNSIVVTECTPTGVNEALQGSGLNSGPSATVSGLQPGETSVDFIVQTQQIPAGDVITVVYSTNQQAIASGNFAGISNVSVEVVQSNQIPITISDLLPNTTYYMTVINFNQTVLLNTSSNQSYLTFSTSINSDTSGQTSNTGPGTINVNIGDFNQPQLADENIQNGLIQCGKEEFYDCDFNALLATVDRVLKFLIYIIALPVAAILFAFAGIKLIIAKAESKQSALSDAKAMMGKVIFGLVFALAAWVIVKFILIILKYNDPLVTQILGISLGQ